MHLLGRTDLRHVLDELGRERDLAAGSGPWTVELLALADAQLGPEWWDVALTGDEAAAIVLPRHAGEPCHGDTMTLVGAAGLTPAEAAARLAAIEGDYARANASCWGRIDRARREPLTRVILAMAPLDHPEYRGLPAGTRLYCVDGLHRLTGWALSGQLAGEALVPAHVVGKRGRELFSGAGRPKARHGK